MKKLILVFLTSLVIFSCGKEKNTDAETTLESTPEVEVKKTEFSIILDAIYEKNDSVILQVYDANGNGYLDKDVAVAVVGSPLAQRIELKSPSGLDIYNMALVFSTNKEQDSFTLKSITMLKDGVEMIKPDNFLYFFANNDQMVMDVNTGVHKLKHEDKGYHPAFVGNDQMKAILED